MLIRVLFPTLFVVALTACYASAPPMAPAEFSASKTGSYTITASAWTHQRFFKATASITVVQ